LAAEIKFPDDMSDLDGPEELRLEYIKGLCSIAGEDARHVTLNVTLALGIVTVLLTQLPQELVFGQSLPVRATMLVGLIALGTSAIFFFTYVRAVHYVRMAIVRCMASANARHARQLWAGQYGVWEQQKRWYFWGMCVLFIGLTLEAGSLTMIFVRGD